jgi:NAD(P)-dependent dehydrogenase (short-subunit alcohol dehydrogenase family)
MVWSGVRALVVGGASGIGRAVGEELLRVGARVAVVDRAPAGAPKGALAVTADVSSTEAVNRAVNNVVDRLGGIDVLVHTAGVAVTGALEDQDDTEWARVLDINVTGTARVVRACLPALRRSPHPAVVLMSSSAARNGLPDRVLYSATKGAVLSMTLALAVDLLPDGIRVNAVCPAVVDTPFIDRLLAQATDPEKERRALQQRNPQGRLIPVHEVVDAVLHLASPRSASTTGVVLDVDGGLSTLRPVRTT